MLLLTTLIVLCISAWYGAVTIRPDEMLSALKKLRLSPDNLVLNERIFLDIRLPRALLCLFVGASLGCGGALMQALFRNPIVEPGLVGTSSGAALGASLYFVLGATFKFNAGEWTLPIAACIGGMVSSLLVLSLARSKASGSSTVVGLLLTGIAINALCMSGVGFMSYIARDPQARSISFWGMGTLSGANWHSVVIVGVSTLACILVALRYGKSLNALMMGESEAMLLGINLRRLKRIVLTINVIMVAVATAFVGVISFVGLVVPHLLRMINGSDNRYLIGNSGLLGGILLSLADVVARMAVRPAELPIGIVTSVVGVPVFILLLRRTNYLF